MSAFIIGEIVGELITYGIVIAVAYVIVKFVYDKWRAYKKNLSA